MLLTRKSLSAMLSCAVSLPFIFFDRNMRSQVRTDFLLKYQKKIQIVNVTPCVSNTHDYINHMFKRP
jgi:hypothetical protein